MQPHAEGNTAPSRTGVFDAATGYARGKADSLSQLRFLGRCVNRAERNRGELPALCRERSDTVDERCAKALLGYGSDVIVARA